jgi:drug/metabolite transporter (DMT)-like permease
MFPQISQGVKHILIAGLFFSVINAAVKYYSHIPAIEIVFFRSIVTLFISTIMVKKLKLKIINEHFKDLFLRGLCGAIALSLYFYTIQQMPLATAVTILYLAPIFTVILAIPMNNEYPHKKQWPFLLLAFFGAALMKGSDIRVSGSHFLMGLTAALFAGLAYNFIRKLKGKANHHLIIFYFPLVTLPFCIPLMIPVWVTPNIQDFFGLITLGVLTQIAQVHMTKAYLLEKASKVSHFNYLTSGYALIMGIFIFNESINLLSIVGLITIIVSVTMSSKIASKNE